MLKLMRATGKDVFGCKAQLKADGFQWVEELKGWFGTKAAVEKFQKRGFRVKVFFAEVDFEHSAGLYSQITGERV